MNQLEANALLASIKSYASLADESNFTIHASEGVHMSESLAKARAIDEPTKLCGYFQHGQVTTKVQKTDGQGWALPKASWTTVSTPTGRSEDVNGVEYMRLVKAFFKSGNVTASPGNTAALANMDGPIPDGFTGFTNKIGTTEYKQVTKMRAIVSKGTNWQLITIYPVS